MKLIEELKARGLVAALTDPAIEQALERPTTVYCGFDPSARSLQAGNLVSIVVLRRFQLAGHKVIALVGGATGLIGDPSGKSAERNMLTVEQVEENKKGIRENLSRILDFDGPNAAVMVDNYDWYKGTSAIEFLRDIAINFRVPQMLAKESVKKRLEASEGALTFTEFSYQILQGNDFLHLYDNYGCRLEVGGADQWGNITAGTDLVHRMRGETAYGLTFPLLLDSSGRKFGKSEGNALFLDATMTPVFDWYQYFLRTPDADAIRYLKVFSMRPLDEIAALEAEMKAHPEARIPQKALAEEVTRLVHGEEGLKKRRRPPRRCTRRSPPPTSPRPRTCRARRSSSTTASASRSSRSPRRPACSSPTARRGGWPSRAGSRSTTRRWTRTGSSPRTTSRTAWRCCAPARRTTSC